MFSNKVFLAAFAVSLTFHGILLLQHANFSVWNRKDNNKVIELSYVKKIEDEHIKEKDYSNKREQLLAIQSKPRLQKIPLPEALNNAQDSAAAGKKISLDRLFDKPLFVKSDVIAVKRKITLQPDKLEINNPAYLNHSQMVREKIKRALYQNYSGTDTGQVNLVFVLTKEGVLKDVRVVDETSVLNPYLKEIVLRSIKDAAPFPNFPKELDYPQLSFNVVISFEIE